MCTGEVSHKWIFSVAAQVHLYEALINVLYRNGPYLEQGAGILKLSYKIFHICNARTGGTSLADSPNAPLWHNPQLKKIAKVPDGACWAAYGVKYAHQLFREKVSQTHSFLDTFSCGTQQRLNMVGGGGALPFQYEKINSWCGSLKVDSRTPGLKPWIHWCPQWSQPETKCCNSIISIDFYTPKRLHKMGRGESPECPRCNAAEGDFFHMLWQCPHVTRYWKAVLTYLEKALWLPNIYSPARCLLSGRRRVIHITKDPSENSFLLCQKSSGP